MQLGTWTVPLLPAVAVGVAVVLACLVVWGVRRARAGTTTPGGHDGYDVPEPGDRDWTGEAAGGAADPPRPARQLTVADAVAARLADTGPLPVLAGAAAYAVGTYPGEPGEAESSAVALSRPEPYGAGPYRAAPLGDEPDRAGSDSPIRAGTGEQLRVPSEADGPRPDPAASTSVLPAASEYVTAPARRQGRGGQHRAVEVDEAFDPVTTEQRWSAPHTDLGDTDRPDGSAGTDGEQLPELDRAPVTTRLDEVPGGNAAPDEPGAGRAVPADGQPPETEVLAEPPSPREVRADPASASDASAVPGSSAVQAPRGPAPESPPAAPTAPAASAAESSAAEPSVSEPSAETAPTPAPPASGTREPTVPDLDEDADGLDLVVAGSVPPPWSPARSAPPGGSAEPVSVAVQQALAARAVQAARARADVPDLAEDDVPPAAAVPDARDRLLSVLLTDPATALGATTDLVGTRERIDALGDVLRRRRADLASAVHRLHRSGLTGEQIGTLAGLEGEDVRAILEQADGGGR